MGVCFTLVKYKGTMIYDHYDEIIHFHSRTVALVEIKLTIYLRLFQAHHS